MPLTTIEDDLKLFRTLTKEESEKATELIPVVESSIRAEAENVGKDLDTLLADASYRLVFKSVVVDVVGRTLMTSTDREPMTQTSESALGYSFSGTFLVPGGGLFIKRSEFARLGLRRQRYGVVDYYDID